MTDQEQEPWPEKMYLLHPSIKTFGAMVSNPERREYVRADIIDQLVKDRKFILDERDRTFALMLARTEEAEAKLDKAVEALNTIVDNGGAGAYHLARIVLAELEGKE